MPKPTKGNPKPTINVPGSPLNGAPRIYKQPPMPKMPKAIGKQQAMTPIGIVDKIKKRIPPGDLVKPASPNALSVPARKIKITETPKDYFPNEIPLEDGSVYKPPKKKRTY